MSHFMKIILFSFFLTTTAFAACKPDFVEENCTIKPHLFPEITIYTYAGFACDTQVMCISSGLLGTEEQVDPLIGLGQTWAWKNAETNEQKIAVLLNWVDVLHPRDGLLRDPSNKFENTDTANFDLIRSQIPFLTKPIVSYPQKDQISVTLWLDTTMSNKRPLLSYEQVIFTVDKKGKITYVVQQEFTIDCWQAEHPSCQITFP